MPIMKNRGDFNIWPLVLGSLLSPEATRITYFLFDSIRIIIII
ncbi:unnamed protein product [Amoebophrya sp. A25]|nr:unnamed protein product [Amoebophrya sp. A25]|eukprot:GSA25T00008219001.1